MSINSGLLCHMLMEGMGYKFMTRVTFIVSRLDIGGAEKILQDIALGIKQDDIHYDIGVICLYEKGKIGKNLSRMGIRIYDRLLRHKFDIRGVMEFIHILRKERPDVLYIAGQALSQVVVLIASMFIKMPTKIIGVHSHDIANRKFYRSLIDSISFYFSDRIICVSESQKQYIAINKKISPDKINVIYNGVDINKFKAGCKTDITKKDLSVPERAVVIGTIASLRKEKAIDVLIEAIPKVIEEYPRALFLIIGEGVERLSLDASAKRLGLNGNLRFLGEREDVDKIIPFFDILCLSSRTENFPLAILEGMACGKPVVATRVGGVPEIVKDRVSGFLAKIDSSDELAECLKSLLGDRQLAARMGREGRKIVEGRFGLDRMIDEYKELFRQVQK